jgi:hypothetical protein
VDGGGRDDARTPLLPHPGRLALAQRVAMDWGNDSGSTCNGETCSAAFSGPIA